MTKQRTIFPLIGIIFAPIFLYALVVDGYQYIFPLPNSRHVSSQSTIIIRFQDLSPKDLTNLSALIEVTGGKSGKHSGKTTIASDQKTIIYRPSSDFLPGETVSVSLNPKFVSTIQKKIKPYTYQFQVSQAVVNSKDRDIHDPFHQSYPDKMTPLKKVTASHAMIMDNGVSVPSDFPHVNITVNDNPDTGLIFIDNRGGSFGKGSPYNIIFNNAGEPIWYLRTSDERRDFKVQRNGWITMMIRGGYGGSGWGFIALDQNYEYIRTFRTSEGYTTDEHELLVLEDGGYMIIGRRDLEMDMSQYVAGGQTNATVRETCLQEFTANDEPVLLWPAFDYFDILELNHPEARLTSGNIRFPHMNAIDIDDDGHIILSSRHINEVTKINRQTGEIIWRLGGKYSDFTFFNDPLNGFSGQHAVRALGNNRYTLFDNGNNHNPLVSRAVEYELDILNGTATLVWEYRNPPNTSYSHYMGNAQRLPNDNTLINWAIGSRPKLTEVRPNGEVAFEMNFADGYECYRVHRCLWNGISSKPSLIVESDPTKVTLIFNKFGDPDIGYYNIYGGISPSLTTVFDTSKSTIKHLTNLENEKYYYFRVRAVNKNGSLIGQYSDEKSVYVNMTDPVEPGTNIVINGDFSSGKDNWTWELQGSGTADWSTQDDIAYINISHGGTSIYDIQLRQNKIPLIQGESYIFEFDAWADASRIIEAKVGQDESPWINYSQIGYSYLTQSKTHFSYPFEMESPSDFNARVVFNTGTDNADAYIDNISLKATSGTGIHNQSVQTPTQHALIGNYPNPFNTQTTLFFVLPEQSHVKLNLYNILGKFEKEICNDIFNEGYHQLNMDGSSLHSGIYFTQMLVETSEGKQIFSDFNKIMLIK